MQKRVPFAHTRIQSLRDRGVAMILTRIHMYFNQTTTRCAELREEHWPPTVLCLSRGVCDGRRPRHAGGRVSWDGGMEERRW